MTKENYQVATPVSSREKIGSGVAEAAVGLALVISIYRHYKTANVDEVNSMKG